jgi:hypothetical protein
MFASNLNLSNPKLPLLTARAKNAIDLAFIKVAAHRKNPSQNPLPSDPKSLERAFNDVLNAVPKGKQDDVMEKYEGLLTPAARTQAYGDLGNVNFASATSVVDQVTAMPLPAELIFTEAEIADLQKQIIAKKVAGKALKNIGQHVTTTVGRAVATAAAPQQAVASSMKFEVVSAKCVKPNDLRKDEMNMVVGSVDGVGAELSAGPFFVGEFKKDTTIDLGTTAEFNFKLADVVFPASFPTFVFMIERDLIHNPELAAKLENLLFLIGTAVKVVSVALFVAGIAVVVAGGGAGIPLLIAALVCSIVAAVLRSAGLILIPILADDFSDVASETLLLDAPPAPGSIFERSLTIENFGAFNRGTYNVLLRWTAVL